MPSTSTPYHFAGYFTKGYPGAVASSALPIAVFEDDANAYITINSPNASERGLLFGQPSQEAAGGIVYNTSVVPNGLSFRTSNNTTKMVISNVGYVGIGTTSPAAGLHIKGAGFPKSFGYFDTDAAGQDAGLRFEEAGTVKAHIFHEASTNTLDLYGSGYSGISVASSGNVGIGTTSPTAKLHVVGNICYTGAIGACSDARYKTDVQTVTGALDKVLQLRGVSYRWKRDEYPNQNFDDRTHVGVIAQELEELFPELVMTDSAGYKSVDYGRLTPVLVEAIKEQQAQIQAQKDAIAALTARLEKLEVSQPRADSGKR